MKPFNTSTHHGNQIILSRLAALAVVMLLALSSFAQRGEKTFGIAGGYAGYNDGGFTKLYFQYSFNQHVRLAPEIGYVFRNEGKSAFEAAADVHFPFRLARGFNIYPLAGVSFNSWSLPDRSTLNRAGFDFGAGLELYLTNHLKLSAQAKYGLMNDTGGLFAGLGIGYVF